MDHDQSIRELVHQWLGFDLGQVRVAFWMPLRSTVVSCVLGHDFSPPLNPAVENATWTLCTDTVSTKS